MISPGNESKVRLILDFSPLAAFFVAYKIGGVLAGTAALMAATAISLLITYIRERRIAPMPLFSGVIIGILGGMTLYLHDETFIKIKPTIVNSLFAAILLGGPSAGHEFMRADLEGL